MATDKPNEPLRRAFDPPLPLPPRGEAKSAAGVAGRETAELTAEALFFVRCGFSKREMARIFVTAQHNRTSVERELIASGLLHPEIYYRFLADRLGLAYLDQIDPRDVLVDATLDAHLKRDAGIRIVHHGRIVSVLVPNARELAARAAFIAARPELREQIIVTTPRTVREAVWAARAEARVEEVTRLLDEGRPSASARRILSARQAYMLAAAKAGLVASLAIAPAATLLVAHIALSGFFLASNTMRISAGFLGSRPKRPALPAKIPADLPIYTVLVALRHEAEIAPQLVRALGRLVWPKSKLDVKFICEADDHETISALRAAGPGPHCEIVKVPERQPMTKPKALQYALAGARGSLVAVYDAEDVPNPSQLLEAWSLFEAGDERLACVQAPLAIANYRDNWLTALFAVEYCGLFRALIPFLGRFGLPVPLGGTSNHFRRSALEAVGGWDPHNVAEDADLGFRLYRAGYRTRAAYHATIETAPDTMGVWLKQRGRWLKGWLQTWLVTMRHPVRALREFGLRGFLTFQVLIAGMLASALLYPAMLAIVVLFPVRLMLGIDPVPDGPHLMLWWLDLANIAASFFAFLFLGWRNLTPIERKDIPARRLAMLPAYWLIMSAAAWRALRQLVRKPHHWDKTPHPARPGAPAAVPQGDFAS